MTTKNHNPEQEQSTIFHTDRTEYPLCRSNARDLARDIAAHLIERAGHVKHYHGDLIHDYESVLSHLAVAMTTRAIELTFTWHVGDCGTHICWTDADTDAVRSVYGRYTEYACVIALNDRYNDGTDWRGSFTIKMAN